MVVRDFDIVGVASVAYILTKTVRTYARRAAYLMNRSTVEGAQAIAGHDQALRPHGGGDYARRSTEN